MASLSWWGVVVAEEIGGAALSGHKKQRNDATPSSNSTVADTGKDAQEEDEEEEEVSSLFDLRLSIYQLMGQELHANGFCVVGGVVTPEVCSCAKEFAFQHGKWVLSVLDQPVCNPSPDLRELLTVPTVAWMRAPKQWPDAGFTTYNKGFVESFGGGQAFKHDKASRSAELGRAQSCAQHLVAGLLGVSPDDVVRNKEGFSWKPSGSDKGEFHLDLKRRPKRNRVPTYQIILPITDTKVVLIPGSRNISTFAGMEELAEQARYFVVEVNGKHKQTLADHGCSMSSVWALSWSCWILLIYIYIHIYIHICIYIYILAHRSFI
jgi:hypothetical protein